MSLAALIVTGHGMATAQVIPAGRIFPEAWQNAGYPGEIPAPSAIINVRDHGAVGDGLTDDSPAVATALAQLSGQAGVIYFPAGQYLLRSQLRPHSGVVLRGERATTTTLRLELIAHGIWISAGQSAAFQPVVSGYTIHSNTIDVTDGGEFTAGDYAEIREENDSAWNASTWAPKVVGQILRITAVTGNSLTLERPLRITYEAAKNPEIRKITPITEVGIENLKVERLLTGTEAQRNNKFTIGFNYAARCWVRGVDCHDGFGGHIGMQYSTQIDVTGCYIHEAHEYDGGGSGYGTRLEFKTGECLIENNIFRHLRHSMLVQAGVNGNVFGYNYSIEPERTEFINDLSSDITLHGNYVYANLYEGNIVQHIWIDNSHGANGPLNTFFRNRAENYGFSMTDPLAHMQNVVGNETFTGGFLGTIAVGDGYNLQGSGHFEYANNTEADGMEPNGTDDLADFSHYLNNDPTVAPPTPTFWNIASTIPTIGPPHALNPSKVIPASARYLAGINLTIGPPSLFLQPVPQSVNEGDPVTFNVSAVGDGTVSYAWRRNGTPLTGATAATLNIASTSTPDAGSYDVVVTDQDGTVTSATAILTVIVSDSDLDGLPDDWENLWFPGDLSAMNSATDTDGDRVLDRDEWIAGTSPLDPVSFFAIESASTENNGATFRLSWPSVIGRHYSVEHSPSLAPGSWTATAVTDLPGTGIIMTSDLPLIAPRGFYRVVVKMP